jgi:hypothetical protein
MLGPGHYDPDSPELFLQLQRPPGIKSLEGPKALDFYTAFAKQQSSMRLASYKLAT